jgi:SAM-dependent methyltransferase
MDDGTPRDGGVEPPRCCFDDWTDDYADEVRSGSGMASAVGRALVDAVAETGLEGRTVLDLGCGVGDVAMGTLARGAARAEGFDLSRRMIDQGRRIAVERGVADRVALHVGDGATALLPRSDVVVLNRVYCCYPDVSRLLENSLGAAGSVYAFTIPPSKGLLGALAKITSRWENTWYALRPKKYAGFRVFIHDVDAIDARVRGAGFHPVRRERRRLTWQLAVYAR